MAIQVSQYDWIKTLPNYTTMEAAPPSGYLYDVKKTDHWRAHLLSYFGELVLFSQCVAQEDELVLTAPPH